MKYARIKRDTEAWVLMYHIFNFHKQWGEREKEVEAFLGFPMDKNIAFEVNNLWIDPRTLKKHRPEWVKEFKKSEYEITSAKANSKVKKEWIALCERLGLKTYKTRDFSWKYGLAFMGELSFHRMFDDYYISLDNDNYDFTTHDWSELVDEPTFLRLQADFIEKQSAETAQAV